MAHSAIDFAELQEMCWAQQIGDLSPEAAARLEQLVVGSTEACEYYIRYAGVCAYLEWSTAPHDQFSDRTIDKSHGKGSCWTPLSSSFPPTTLHGTLGYFPEGMPLAYLLATVMTGLGLLIGSLVHVSRPEQVASQFVCASVVAEPNIGSWAGSPAWSTASGLAGSRVSLGQKFDLASGLMEITYDTGAKVILQGPVKY